jgi:predicted dehydrogenase
MGGAGTGVAPVSRRAVLAGAAAGTARPSRIDAAVIAQRGVNVAPYLKELGASDRIRRIALRDAAGELFPLTAPYLGARERDLERFRDPAAMLLEVRPSLTVVSLEAHLAPAAVRQALEAGSHVAVEKPGCVRIEDFDRLTSLAASRGRHLMLALATRLHPGARRARELVRAGAIGAIYGASMQWVGDQTRLRNPEYHRSRFASRARAGGKLLFQGIHYLDLLAWLTGDRIERVAARTGNVGGQPIEVEDAAAVALRFAGRWRAVLNTGYYLDRGFDNRVEIWGSRGWLRFDPMRSLEWRTADGAVQSYAPPEADLYRLMFANAAAAAVFAAYRSAETRTAQAAA